MFNKSAGCSRSKRASCDELRKLRVNCGSNSEKVWRVRSGVKRLVRIGNGVAG